MTFFVSTGYFCKQHAPACHLIMHCGEISFRNVSFIRTGIESKYNYDKKSLYGMKCTIGFCI